MFQVTVDRLVGKLAVRVDHLTENFPNEVLARKRQREINDKAFTPLMAYVNPL